MAEQSPSSSVRSVIQFLVFGVFIGLALVMLHGNGQLLNSQIKVWGENSWPGYNTMFTLGDVSCDLERLSANRAKAEAALANPQAEKAEKKDDVDALFDDDGSDASSPKEAAKDDVDALFEDDESPKKAEPKAPPKDDVDALFEDDEAPKKAEPKAQPKDDVDALFDDEDEAAPKKAPEGDDVDALFGDDDSDTQTPTDKRLTRLKNEMLAAKSAENNCRAKHEAYKEKQKTITPGVRRYRAVHTKIETFVLSGTNYYKHFLVIILLLCVIVTTVKHHHISLRPVETGWRQAISGGAQLVVHGMLAYSFWRYYEIQKGSEDAQLATFWMVGLGILCLINLYHVVTSKPAAGEAFTGSAILSMPLYCMMALLSGTYFLFIKDYPSGLAAKLGLITVNAKLYLQVGLYVWVGMLLKQSLVTRKIFDVVRPLKLAPELLAIVVVLGAAVPTAYSGASGIFVIAAGGIIYLELRAAGSRQSLALASTAMSGSLGVVLSPCLLVVIVASLDNSVTTDELFTWGARVFFLTAILFALFVLLTRQNPLTMTFDNDARAGVRSAFRGIIPYIAAFVIGLGFCYFVLGAKLDELWAPYLLPLFMFGFLIYERKSGAKDEALEQSADMAPSVAGRFGLATRESSIHIGALLFLMGMSVTLGAMVEDAELMHAVSVDFGNVWLTMSLLVVVLVIIGMTMDPYGAVILVAATISGVAKQAGIDMIHFWMVVLVAFELGYLTPPVALNHLLTRQVVGNVEIEQRPGDGFYHRHERYVLPILVLGIALLIVAFGPLLYRMVVS